MKRIILLLAFSLFVNVCSAQQWFSSFDVAKRIAHIQNKMLFVLWEDSFNYNVPLFIVSESGKPVIIDISKDTSFDAVIWDYFIPVRLSEAEYVNFFNNAKGRNDAYINKLNDESVKIMDYNGNILNIYDTSHDIMNLSVLVEKYALNTSYLASDLKNYTTDKRFLTSTLLAMRYVDFAIFSDEEVRSEIIALANIYLDESENFLEEMTIEDKTTYLQKIELIRIKELLVLNHYKKAARQIKRIDESEVAAINQSLFVFLNYTVLKLMDDEINAELWKSKISLLDLKMAELILTNQKNSDSN